jgi:hypothetical protein
MRTLQEQFVDCGVSQQTGTTAMSPTPSSSPSSSQMAHAYDPSDSIAHIDWKVSTGLPVDTTKPSPASPKARPNVTMADGSSRSPKRRKTNDTVVHSSDAVEMPSSSAPSTPNSQTEGDRDISMDGDDALGSPVNKNTPKDRDRATSIEIEIPPATMLTERVSKEDMYWDEVDSIYRCETCHHEIWSTACLEGGFCTGCGNGQTSYVEDIALNPRPRVFSDEYDSDSVTSETKQEIYEEHLDYQSSAYDTQDEDADLDEDYERNSFIDDEVIEEPKSEDDGNEDGESGSDDEGKEKTDFKQAFENMQKSYQELLASHSALILEHDEMMRDFLGSDYEDDEEMDGMGIVNEEGMHLVDAVPPEVKLTEVTVGSSFRGFDVESDHGNLTEEKVGWNGKGKGKAVMREASEEL